MEQQRAAREQLAAADKHAGGLQKGRDDLHRQAGELVEGLRTAACVAVRCNAATSRVVQHLQQQQSREVCHEAAFC